MNKIQLLYLFGTISLIAAGLSSCESKPELVQNTAPTVTLSSGLSTPESALHDTVADVYLVSNINGSPFGEDKKGYILQVKPDGTSSGTKWIDGSQDGVELNAPKGMAIVGDILYVTDVTSVRKFDRKSGKALGSIAIEGSSFLNDAYSPPGSGVVYVSDTGFAPGFEPSGSDAIYKIDAADTVTPLYKGKDLGNPNGLFSEGEDILVITWTTGALLKIDPKGTMTEIFKLPKGQLDGIEKDSEGKFLISSWEGTCIYQADLSNKDATTVKVPELNAPADIGFDSKRKAILLPYFKDNKLDITKM